MKKVLVAMSHALTSVQIEDLKEQGFEAVISERFIELNCNNLAPNLNSSELNIIANKLVNEASQKECEAIAMTGEPMLTFHVWNLASKSGLSVLQSTTERKTVEKVQEDGSILKTQIFNHVQWRKL